TGRPLARARVALIAASAPGRPLLTSSSNSLGNFELRDVPPGSYFVSASRAGYLELQYGQRRPRERGTAVTVRDGEIVSRIDIALPRGSVLAGRITDDAGHPYPGIQVNVWEMRYREGRRLPFPAGGARTDDLGDYRIVGLPPGAYHISASSPETWRNEKNETFGFATTYYASANAGPPLTIALEVAQQRLDLDVSLAASRTARVTGRVIRPTGEPMAGEGVALSLTIPGTGLTFVSGTPVSTRTAADGGFELHDVPPGGYVIRAGARNETAFATVVVSGNVDNILLVPTSGSPVTGMIVTDEGTEPPFTASGVRLNLVSDSDRVKPTVRLPAVNNDWTFSLSNVGGPFMFRVQGLPPGWMLDAVRIGDRDITDVPFDVPTGGKEVSGLQIVITEKVGKIGGTVVTADRGAPASDATVVVFSEDEDHWIFGSRLVRSARPASDGTYTIAGLPAGNYLVVARQTMMDGEWESPEFLAAAKPDGVRIELAAGESSKADVKVKAP
ncbi:MAG: carboxypeptidase-like regulatory domain-containing protein, partial [Acidobacteriota bacterium]|nr:carboxypeptidase-like regulatory domain-containing protein [Acidobacteriota bacterium]